MKQALVLGWMLALVASAAAVGEYYWLVGQQEAALAQQAADYEARLLRQKIEAEAQLKKQQDDAAAALLVLQTELDFARLPELPIKTVFRPGQVLYVESDLQEPFACKVRLSRPGTSATAEVDFEIRPRSFRDLGALENWMFQRGDRVEFVKAGFKPRPLVVP